MVDQISIDFSRLSATRDHITQTVNSMNGTLSDLKGYIKPLAATWTGDASNHYQTLQKNWDDSASDLNTVLGKISAALTNAITDMQAAEKKNAGRFGG